MKKSKSADAYGCDVWNTFQKALEPYDNSMGDLNYLIGRFIYESGNYDKKEFVKKIKSYLK